jgi:hypothetical protein
MLIRKKAQIVSDIRRRMAELTAGKPGFSVDDFIAERRRDAVGEDQA